MKKLIVKIKGTAPILFNNGDQVNPFNPLMIEKKRYTSKKVKTEADLKIISDLEWKASLYIDEKGGIIIPALNFEASIRNGAKKSKLGKQIQAGLMVDNDASLIYNGSKELTELINDRNYSFIIPVRIQQKKVTKTRAMFKEWSAQFTVSYNESILNKDQVIKSIEDAGMYCGLGDWLPRFGRFDIEKN